jgi:hypothetical protein
VLAALGGVWYLRRPSAPPPPPAPVLAANQTPEYQAAIGEGQRKLLAGDFAGAATAFAEAERLAPGDEAAANLKAEAERQASHQLEQIPSAAPAAVAPAGRTVTSAAPAPPRPAPATPPAQTAAAPAPEATAASGNSIPANRAELRIDFQTEVSPGTVTIYIGRDQVLREPFRFTRRSGLRTTSVPGGWNATRAVGAGDNSLRVIVSLDGRPTRVVNLQGNFRGGSSRSLVIRIDGAGEVSATLQ